MTLPMKPIELRRWQVVAAFAANVAAIVVVVVLYTNTSNNTNHAVARISRDEIQLHQAIRRIDREKANISTLERSNCRVRTFLLSSAKLRLRVAEAEMSTRRRAADLKAARVAKQLAQAEANEQCPA